MLDYIRDGQEIYRRSFATIRAEANLNGIPADLEKLAVRVIHACGMVDVVEDLRFSPVLAPLAEQRCWPVRRSSAMRAWSPRASPARACRLTTK